MISREEKKKTVIEEETTSVKCDICHKELLGTNQDVRMCTMVYSEVSQESYDEDAPEVTAQETTDLCEKHYRMVLQYIRSVGGKAPSFYDSCYNPSDAEEEMEKEDA
jgi:hypothetical protein